MAVGAAFGLASCGAEDVAGFSDGTGGKLGASGGASGSGSAAGTGGTVTGNGGKSASGGRASTGGKSGGGSSGGGSTGSGGSRSTGGASSGGVPATGGVPSTGGKPSTGGTSNTGGKASTGGAPNTGGVPSTGGAANTGGKASTGGAPNTGGTANTGGAQATGGTPGTGGSGGGCECITEALTWATVGGIVASQPTSTVTPCKLYTYSQYPIASTDIAAPPRPIPYCTHELYPCTGQSLNIGDLLEALAHPDVKAAFAKGSIVYGHDTRPVDGTVFQMTYGNGVVVVGTACTAMATAACIPIPEGVAALVKTLRALDVQEQKRCNVVQPVTD